MNRYQQDTKWDGPHISQFRTGCEFSWEDLFSRGDSIWRMYNSNDTVKVYTWTSNSYVENFPLFPSLNIDQLNWGPTPMLQLWLQKLPSTALCTAALPQVARCCQAIWTGTMELVSNSECLPLTTLIQIGWGRRHTWASGFGKGRGKFAEGRGGSWHQCLDL